MNANLILALLVFWPFLGGLLVWVIGGYSKDNKAEESSPASHEEVREEGSILSRTFSCFTKGGAVTVFFTVTEFLLMLFVFINYVGQASEGTIMSLHIPGICGFGLSFTLDGFRLIYGLIAGIMWMMTSILCQQYFKGHHNTARFYVFMVLTLGATMGVFLSSDLYTTFIFFEIMSFTSYVWVAHEENNAALRAADTYLAVAVLGGLVMLMGIFGLWHELGTVEMAALPAAAAAYENKTLLYILGGCLFFGFGAKAGAFPLHIWLPKAHPVAPAPASALLSGILTKVGIFGVIVTTSGIFMYDKTWGTIVLIVGALTMFLGAMLAVFSIDLKRTLACSSMSQIGFILIGVGMQCMLGEENALAVHGTLLHMINHSMIKLVLFMAAGVIFMNAHSLDLNVIRGYGRKKPLLKVIFLIGALAIGGIPMFGGYISKTLLHESIVEFGGGWIFRGLEYLFLFSGGLTVAYMTKLFVSIFVEKNEDMEVQKKYDSHKKYMNPATTFALAGSALVLLIWGLFPYQIMNKAAELGQGFMGLEEFGEAVHYFSWSNLQGALISITIGAIVYIFIIRGLLMKAKKPEAAPLTKKSSKTSGRSKTSASPALARTYINAWPEKLDLENLIYRPLLMKVLPAIFGAICRVFDLFIDTAVRIVIPVGAVVARVFDSVADLSVVGLRKSIYKDSPIPHERTEGSFFTDLFGSVMNFWQKLGNLTWSHRKKKNVDYRHLLALRREARRTSNTIIERTMSYGLMLAGIGLALTLIYIIWM